MAPVQFRRIATAVRYPRIVFLFLKFINKTFRASQIVGGRNPGLSNFRLLRKGGEARSAFDVFMEERGGIPVEERDGISMGERDKPFLGV